jgi:hypothetical protein
MLRGLFLQPEGSEGALYLVDLNALFFALLGAISFDSRHP